MQNGQNITLTLVTVQCEIVLIKKARTKQFLTRKHKKIRVEWCQKRPDRGNNEWKKVVFSDESHICLGTGNNVGTFV